MQLVNWPTTLKVTSPYLESRGSARNLCLQTHFQAFKSSSTFSSISAFIHIFEKHVCLHPWLVAHAHAHHSDQMSQRSQVYNDMMIIIWSYNGDDTLPGSYPQRKKYGLYGLNGRTDGRTVPQIKDTRSRITTFRDQHQHQSEIPNILVPTQPPTQEIYFLNFF